MKKHGKGRPPMSPDGSKVRRLIAISPWLDEWLRRQGERKASGLIEEALCQRYRLKPPEGE